MNDFNLIGYDATYCVFKFLDPKSLGKMRCVNKEFKALADLPGFYSPENYEIKVQFKEYYDLNLKYTKYFQQIQVKNAKIEERSKRDENWFGFFVTHIIEVFSIDSKITHLFCTIFPSIRTEIEIREKIESELTEIVKDGIEDSALLELKKMEESSFKKYQDLKKAAKLRKDKLAQFEKVASLFGGINGFESLPVIQGVVFQPKDYIDYILPAHMTAPIMRGVDDLGRIFFTIRFRDIKTNEMHCQTFFERHIKAAIWSAGTRWKDFIPNPCNVFDRGHDKDFERLAIAIQVGHYGNNIIE